MAKFIIRYTEEVWNRLEVEAENKEEAENIFWGGECDYDSAKVIGGEVQGDILIEKVSA